jgi:hypothetical protein
MHVMDWAAERDFASASLGAAAAVVDNWIGVLRNADTWTSV